MASRALGFNVSRSSSDSESAFVKSTSLLGMVSVPVLSITNASTRRMFSSAVASLIRMLLRAALPMPTIKAVGVASPSAHGQAITNTDTADITACGSWLLPPMAYHNTNVSSDNPSTTGTKTRAILSTMRCTGALLPCASCTVFIMRASIVPAPTSAARNRIVPLFTTVPANTLSPAAFLTGTGSPVIMLSSIYASPSFTHPSTGILSPGRTSITSPFSRVDMGTSVVSPPETSRAVFGCKPISERMAAAVPCFARSSSTRPVSTNVIIITEAS